MRFSERQGIKPVKTVIQTDNMDADLRNGLWNALTRRYWNKARIVNDWYGGDENAVHLVQLIWSDYFKEPIDTIPNQWTRALSKPRDYFLACQWRVAHTSGRFLSGCMRPK